MKLLVPLGALLTLCASATARQRILLYTKTATFRHDSIPTAISQIVSWSNTTWPGFDVVHTEDQGRFDQPGWLDQFDALLFVSTSGRILSRKGQKNMISYLKRGGGFMGVHEASDCVYEPWYNRLVGAQFNYHPQECQAEMLVQDTDHPSVAWIKNGSWWTRDEMYNFASDPRIYGRKVALSVNESSYHDPVSSIADRAAAQGSPHPIAWYKEGGLLDPVAYTVGGDTDDTSRSIRAAGGTGRMFYTGLGHSNETWLEEEGGFKKHFLGGLGWVLNSTQIRSFSADQESDKVGQPWEAYPPYPTPPPEEGGGNPLSRNKQAHSTNAAAGQEARLNNVWTLLALTVAGLVACLV